MTLSRRPVPDLANCTRFKGGTCARCREACPTGALAIDDGLVLDTGRCRACGACVAACPAEALHHDAARDLLRTISQLMDRREVVTACFAVAATSTEALRLNGCLSCLGVESLIHIAALEVGQLRLVHGDCAACALGDGGRMFALALEACEQLLDGVANRTAFSPTRGTRRTGQAASPALSRRGFLGLIGSGLRPRSGEADDALGPVRAQGRQAPPAQRMSLHCDLRRLKPAAGGPARVPAAGLELRGDCQACAACARICPTGALEFTGQDGEFRLGFTAWKCIDCGLCRTACRAGCLVRLPAGLAALLEEGAVPLANGRLGTCKRCRAQTAVLDPAGYCPLCSGRFGVVERA